MTNILKILPLKWILNTKEQWLCKCCIYYECFSKGQCKRSSYICHYIKNDSTKRDKRDQVISALILISKLLASIFMTWLRNKRQHRSHILMAWCSHGKRIYLCSPFSFPVLQEKERYTCSCSNAMTRKIIQLEIKKREDWGVKTYQAPSNKSKSDNLCQSSTVLYFADSSKASRSWLLADKGVMRKKDIHEWLLEDVSSAADTWGILVAGLHRSSKRLNLWTSEQKNFNDSAQVLCAFPYGQDLALLQKVITMYNDDSKKL